ncbi:hypothetical protein D3C78_1973890 [compost metagenome]
MLRDIASDMRARDAVAGDVPVCDGVADDEYIIAAPDQPLFDHAAQLLAYTLIGVGFRL